MPWGRVSLKISLSEQFKGFGDRGGKEVNATDMNYEHKDIVGNVNI